MDRAAQRVVARDARRGHGRSLLLGLGHAGPRGRGEALPAADPADGTDPDA